jgi:hypothetical protein
MSYIIHYPVSLPLLVPVHTYRFALSYVCQINNVRLLEAHMACLCMEFEAWAKSEPEEPQGENPTEQDNAAFEAAEKEHEEKVCLRFFFLHCFPFVILLLTFCLKCFSSLHLRTLLESYLIH